MIYALCATVPASDGWWRRWSMNLVLFAQCHSFYGWQMAREPQMVHQLCSLCSVSHWKFLCGCVLICDLFLVHLTEPCLWPRWWQWRVDLWALSYVCSYINSYVCAQWALLIYKLICVLSVRLRPADAFVCAAVCSSTIVAAERMSC